MEARDLSELGKTVSYYHRIFEHPYTLLITDLWYNNYPDHIRNVRTFMSIHQVNHEVWCIWKNDEMKYHSDISMQTPQFQGSDHIALFYW